MFDLCSGACTTDAKSVHSGTLPEHLCVQELISICRGRNDESSSLNTCTQKNERYVYVRARIARQRVARASAPELVCPKECTSVRASSGAAVVERMCAVAVTEARIEGTRSSHAFHSQKSRGGVP